MMSRRVENRVATATRALRARAMGVALCALACLGLGFGWSDAVEAHARLVRAKPAAEAELGAAPKAITLWFNEQPEADFSSVKVMDAHGTVVVEGALARTQEPNGLELAVPKALPAGTYTVRYRVLSVDGHVIEDSFTFRIGAAPE